MNTGGESFYLSRDTIHVLLEFAVLLMLASSSASAQFVNPRYGKVLSDWERYNQTGIGAFRQGDIDEAEKQFLSAAHEAEAYLPDDPRRATTLNNLGQVYHALGKYMEAEPKYLDALAIDEKISAPPYARLLIAANLGDLYRDWGKYAQAEPYYERSLALVASADAQNEPVIPFILGHLAETCRVQKNMRRLCRFTNSY